MKDYEKLLAFLQKSPTPFHLVEEQAKTLRENGYTFLDERAKWNLMPGGKYYTTRNGSAILAFRIPENGVDRFHILASHSDSPTFKLKEDPELTVDDVYVKLNTELYGSAILYTWLDRPLSFAGRVMVKENGRLKSMLVNIDRDLLLIPSLAIHMNKKVNDGHAFNMLKDMPPLFGGKGSSVKKLIAEEYGLDPEDILASDLFVYNRTAPSVWGAGREYLSAPRLDDAACAFASLEGFLRSETKKEGTSVPVHAVFDNEEVGSTTKQGAASTFLKDVLTRIQLAAGSSEEDRIRWMQNSFMISADNGHAIHPNYPEVCDVKTHPHMGEGILIKFSANQKYTTDAESAAICALLCEEAAAPYQFFYNRSDMTGGSTLGNISGTQVALSTVDIGLAELAMHSSYETCSVKDLTYLIRLSETLFSAESLRP